MYIIYPLTVFFHIKIKKWFRFITFWPKAKTEVHNSKKVNPVIHHFSSDTAGFFIDEVSSGSVTKKTKIFLVLFLFV